MQTQTRIQTQMQTADRLTYPQTIGYPDILDLKSALEKLSSSASTEEIYQDFRRSYQWLRFVQSFRHFHGKHLFLKASEVLFVAESFLGYKIDEVAFRAAIQKTRFKTKNANSAFDRLEIKLPDLSDIDELLPKWRDLVELQGPILRHQVSDEEIRK